MIENSISISIGYRDHALDAGATALIINNVALSGKIMDPTGLNPNTTTAVYGIQVDSNSFNNAGTSIAVENNIVANVKDYATNYAIKIPAAVGSNDNVVYNWRTDEDMYDLSGIAGAIEGASGLGRSDEYGEDDDSGLSQAKLVYKILQDPEKIKDFIFCSQVRVYHEEHYDG